MENYDNRELAKLRRVKQFGDDHPLVPANPLAAAEYTGVSNAITNVEQMAEAQSSGNGTKSGAVDQRLQMVDDLLDLMRSLSKASKVLETTLHPDVATKMRMDRFGSFEQLLVQANVFHSTLEPIEAEFIALGASATVAADLQALITALEGAGNLKLSGLDTQVGGTVGIKFAIREGLKHVRKLDAILCQVYRTNPVLLAQWKTARRTERAPVTETEPETDSVPAAPAP